MIFSTNMVTALTLSCMLSTQMDKITYPRLLRHSWKTVQNKDIVAIKNERAKNFLQFDSNPNFLAPFLWILWRFEVKHKNKFLCNIFQILHAWKG